VGSKPGPPPQEGTGPSPFSLVQELVPEGPQRRQFGWKDPFFERDNQPSLSGAFWGPGPPAGQTTARRDRRRLKCLPFGAPSAFADEAIGPGCPETPDQLAGQNFSFCGPKRPPWVLLAGEPGRIAIQSRWLLLAETIAGQRNLPRRGFWRSTKLGGSRPADGCAAPAAARRREPDLISQ